MPLLRSRYSRPRNSRVLVPLALSAALALAGCEAPAPTILAPDAGASASHDLGNRVVRSLTGDGVVDLSSAGVPPQFFEVSVHQRESGEVFGTFWHKRASGGLNIEFTGRATCLAIDEATGRAWVGGVILENRSTSPAAQDPALHAPGKDIWFRVLDRGEGAAAEPDRSTTVGFRGSAGLVTSAEYCATRPWPDTPTPNARTFPLAEGNLMVHIRE